MIGIIGAGGHAKVVVDALQRTCQRHAIIVFSTDVKHRCGKFFGLPHLPESEIWSEEWLSRIHQWHVAIGSANTRKEIGYRLISRGLTLCSIIHPNSIVSPSSTIGAGTFVAAGAVINADANIGIGCIVNTASSVDHDCLIGDYVNVGPGSHLCGGVKVGEETELGSGAITVPGVRIGSQCTVGAGAVVIRNLPDRCTAIGVPARIISTR